MFYLNYPHFTGLEINSQAKQSDQAQKSCKGKAEIWSFELAQPESEATSTLFLPSSLSVSHTDSLCTHYELNLLPFRHPGSLCMYPLDWLARSPQGSYGWFSCEGHWPLNDRVKGQGRTLTLRTLIRLGFLLWRLIFRTESTDEFPHSEEYIVT